MQVNAGMWGRRFNIKSRRCPWQEKQGKGVRHWSQLVNLAQFYGNAERHDEAVALFEEALKVGEESGHPQVDVDRKMLKSARILRHSSPEERAQLHSDSEESGNSEEAWKHFEATITGATGSTSA